MVYLNSQIKYSVNHDVYMELSGGHGSDSGSRTVGPRSGEIKRTADSNRDRSSSPVLKRKCALTDDYVNNNMSDMIRQTSPIRNRNINSIEGRTMHSPLDNHGGNKSFGNDSLLNESLFGALDDVERANLGKNSSNFNESLNNIFEDSFSVNDVIFKHSMHSTPKRELVICNEVSNPEPSVELKPFMELPKLEEKPGGSRSNKPKKKDAKKGKKKGKFKVAYTNRKHVQLLSESGTNELSREELSALSEEDKLYLSSWGLPESTLSKYRFKGKTLVSEILMLKRVLELGKKAIMILPFVSVAREKMYSLQELFGDAGVKVEGFMGSYNPPGGFKSVDIAICTIEKANSLINRLLTEGNLSQLGTVVVDELHLVGDPHRGYLLELLLTKIKFMSGKKVLPVVENSQGVNGTPKSTSINIQIIGMSATLPNLPLLATWLDAELVTTDYRPVPLMERLKIGDKIYDSSLREIRPVHLDSLQLQISNDPDGIIYLSLETVLNGHSVLIFCPTRAWCERLAEQVAREFFNIGKPNSNKLPEIGKQLRDQLNSEKIQQVLHQLNQCPAGKDEMLAATAAFGVGFHHAGLTFDERDILESAFKRGALRVIIATSTLSAGVNLPARRVIICSPVFNGAPLDALTYKQMSGRAGRKGVDTEGESILICSRESHDIGTKLIQSSLPSVTSALLSQSGYLTSSMKRALLEVVASGITKSAQEVHQYTKSTLLALGGDSKEELPASQDGGSIIEECLEFLVENEFIKLVKYEDNDKNDEYVATQLGSACLSSSLSPDEGILVFKELLRARQCFVLANELHTIYQVTPIYLSDQWRNVDWNQYLNLYSSLNPEELRVAQLVGVEERFILSAIMSTVSWKNPMQRAKLSIHQRFYTALALNDLVNEMPIAKVTEKYGVTKGVVQNLQQSASTFAGMVTTFCSRLVRLSLVNGQRARILYNAGIQSVADLATCDPAQVEQVFHRAGPFISNVHGENGGGTIYVLGKQEALSENEASKLIVEEARQFLQSELGLKSIEFRKAISV
ncbi:unnamed protein product [Allacma fusca]|uniref:DNA polymerase theta n=1 Tax=Allacma fusca TaxID=39272 RepID=A0A8J2PUC4_9HEXA|nr:unnamed protein product [Allacma fusca]